MLSDGGKGVSCDASAQAVEKHFHTGLTPSASEDEPEPQNSVIVKTEKSDKDKLNVGESHVVTTTKKARANKSHGVITVNKHTTKKPLVSEGRMVGTKHNVRDGDDYDAEGEDNSVKVARVNKKSTVELGAQVNALTEKVIGLYALYTAKAGKKGAGPMPPLKFNITVRPEYAKELAEYNAELAAGKAPKSHVPP